MTALVLHAGELLTKYQLPNTHEKVFSLLVAILAETAPHALPRHSLAHILQRQLGFALNELGQGDSAVGHRYMSAACEATLTLYGVYQNWLDNDWSGIGDWLGFPELMSLSTELRTYG